MPLSVVELPPVIVSIFSLSFVCIFISTGTLISFTKLRMCKGTKGEEG